MYLLLQVCYVLHYVVIPKKTPLLKNAGEIVISVNKWEQKLNEVPNKIVKINKLDILRNNPQTSADLLSQTGAVFVQKSTRWRQPDDSWVCN